jgi:Undecaprenyl-phosphate galactose phosphotransferase WbaP
MRVQDFPASLALRSPTVAGRIPASLVIIATDFVALALAFSASVVTTDLLQIRLFDRDPGEFYSPYLGDRAMIVAALCVPLAAWFARHRHYTGRRTFWTELKHILLGVGFVMLVDGWLHFAMKVQVSRLWHVHLWVYAAAFLVTGRILVRKLLVHLGQWQRATLVVGKQEDINEFKSFAARERYLGYEVRASIPTEQSASALLQQLSDQLADPRLAYVAIASDGLSTTLLSQLVEMVERRRIRYGVIPPLRKMPLLGLEIEDFFGSDFIMLQNHRRSLEDPTVRTLKRCFDIGVASVLIVLTSPLMLALAFLIRLDGQPVLYRSSRIGYRYARFSALKFRTMRENAGQLLARLLATDLAIRAEWEANFKLRNDPRITPLGRLMRRTSLDELPQLFNVIRGDMSLVGPRPILPDEVERYRPCMHLYTSVRPGITGMWQVSGRNSIDYDKRIQLNNWYVHNWSFWHDTVILTRTVQVVLSREGAA